MPDESSANSFLLGFLVVEPTAKGDGFVSAIMVTDGRGYPLEFKATTPVRPSLVQKTLYGATLDKYVGVELCGKSLVRQLARKPEAILVPKRDLLEIGTDATPAVVAIWRAGEQLSVAPDNSGPHGTINPQEGAQPLIYEGRFRDASKEADTLRALEDFSARFDLIETFGRMREALKLLPKEDKRYA
jgi:hypothetical protein